MDRIHSLSVVIPAFNEEKAILTTLERITAVLNKSLNLGYEIIVVNDGSTDMTGELLRSYPGITLIDRKVNRGYGFSLKEGIERADNSWILIVDADSTYPLEDIPVLAHEAEHYDMVVGERSKEDVSIGILNRFAKYVLKSLIYLLTYKWITDINSGFRLFKKEILLKYSNIFPDGFSFTTTITLVSIMEKYRVKYVPINYQKRTGKSHIKPLRDFLSFVILVLRIVTFFKPLRFFLPISFFFFVLSLIRSARDIYIANSIGSLSILLFMVSMQSFFFGLLADLIVTKFGSKNSLNRNE